MSNKKVDRSLERIRTLEIEKPNLEVINRNYAEENQHILMKNAYLRNSAAINLKAPSDIESRVRNYLSSVNGNVTHPYI